jgi:hypothetical protein
MILKCKTCKRTFNTKAGVPKTQKYCSKKCYNTQGKNNPNWQGGPKLFICKQCNNNFHLANYQITTGKYKGLFCSFECNNKYKSIHKIPDSQNRLNRNMRRAVTRCIHEQKLSKHWVDLVGYTSNDLMQHLESQFTNGMTWDNYGKWHIDHIKPVVLFNFTKFSDSDFKKCWSLNNLQPLWAFDNLSKNRKYENDKKGI